jgi:pRiA4b ORF-3-like protein
MRTLFAPSNSEPKRIRIMKKKNIVFQFRIALKEIAPPIWRRIQVISTATFWDLHVAIQDAMGWLDYHQHVFRIKKPRAKNLTVIGIPPDDDYEDQAKILSAWEEDIGDYFVEPGKTADYIYDFGDSWEHDILFEGILLKEKAVFYPLCISGARACPPEDCGGIFGYHDFLEIIHNPAHEEHETMMQWGGRNFDSELFRAKDVTFDNPKKRLKKAFEGIGQTG